jgi:hypothetical protein
MSLRSIAATNARTTSSGSVASLVLPVLPASGPTLGQPPATAGLPEVQIRASRRSRMRQPSGVRISWSS